MKTTLRILALCMVAVLMVGVLAACAPNKDPKKAAANLKEEGYTVTSVTKGSTVDDLAISAVELALKIEGVEAIVSGYKSVKDEDDEMIAIYYFDTAAHAKDAFEKVQDAIEEDEKDDKSENKKEIVIKKSGKMIYGGTKAAIKAAH